MLINHLKITSDDIQSITKIDVGFTNNIFHVVLTNNNHYKIRIVNNNPYINRCLEKIIENHFYHDDIFFYDDNGNFIKKWYIGNSLANAKLNYYQWIKIKEWISELQKININHLNINKPVYVLSDHVVEKNLIKPLLAYKKIINENVKTNCNVLAHNDLSSNNIILCNDEVKIIDFEWASYNHPYWDIANLIKDLELTIEDVIANKAFDDYDLNLLIKIIYATHFYTYYWTYKVEPTQKIIAYRNDVIKQIHYWYNILKTKGLTHD